MKACQNCIHWKRKYKTHGDLYCELSERNYCISHKRCYHVLKRVFHSLKEIQENNGPLYPIKDCSTCRLEKERPFIKFGCPDCKTNNYVNYISKYILPEEFITQEEMTL